MKYFITIIIAVIVYSSIYADDRQLFGLKGPVKRADYSIGFTYLSYPENQSAVREFTPSGEYVYFTNPGTDDVKIEREEDKVRATIRHWGDITEMQWELTKGYVTNFKCKDKESEYTHYIDYENGFEFSEGIVGFHEDGRRSDAVAVFKVLEKDKHGNWTKRKAVYNRSLVKIETCELEYYTPEEITTAKDKSGVADVPTVALSVDNTLYDSNSVEQSPTFAGGDAAMMKFINSKLRYPLIAQENGIQGKVIVQVVVNKDGSLDIVNTLGCNDSNLVKEAKRIVSLMPPFTPGKQQGNPVRTKYNIPISFRLK